MAKKQPKAKSYDAAKRDSFDGLGMPVASRMDAMMGNRPRHPAKMPMMPKRKEQGSRALSYF